ncbi:hypothetical protein [Spiribacter onubensis]|uniref:HTH arsR-type domain-containing protein n=1 Tax=Spiribacter onubensis TaxID=3122420 RepID=A0ABV3S6M1_9GAMM
MGAQASRLTETLRGAEFHRIISDERRLRALTCLYEAGELESETLAGALSQEPAQVRQTLAELTACGVLSERRERFQVHYRLADGLPAWVGIALGAARDWGVAAPR